MIALDRLIACALGDLSGDDELAVEEHVLSCDACARRYASFVRIGPAIAALLRSGSASTFLTRDLVARFEAEGLVTRRYELEPGRRVPCTVDGSDIYALATFHADLRGVERVDLERMGQRVTDVPFDPTTGRVYMITSCDFIRSLPTMEFPLRLIAVDAHGDRTLGDYLLDHTAPG